MCFFQYCQVVCDSSDRNCSVQYILVEFSTPMHDGRFFSCGESGISWVQGDRDVCIKCGVKVKQRVAEVSSKSIKKGRARPHVASTRGMVLGVACTPRVDKE